MKPQHILIETVNVNESEGTSMKTLVNLKPEVWKIFKARPYSQHEMVHIYG